jgi:3-dehydrosphinganine reductase
MLQLILAGILALPALLFSVIAAIVVGVLSLPSMAVLKFRKPNKIDKNDKHKTHAIITGGSSGIGLAVAKECVKKGIDRVTILARNQDKLNQCQQSLESLESTTKIHTVSVDVTDANALETVASKVLSDSNETVYLFCCAGTAKPGKFTELSPNVFQQQMQTNYLGSVYTIHAFLPLMARGTIIMTSSAGGQVGVFGYTAYAPSKFALRGFAECLHMELLDKDIHVQLVYPPDTDTPGYLEENKDKPHETHLISETMALIQPEQVANRMVNEAASHNPKFAVYFALEGWMLSTLTAGMSPENSYIDAVAQVSLMGLLRMLSFFFLNDFWRIIANYQKQSPGEKKEQDYGSTKKQEDRPKTGRTAD